MTGRRTKFRCPACRVRGCFSLTWFNGHFYCPRCFRARAINYVRASEAIIFPARREAQPSSFERAMERVRNGAGITIVRPIPRPEPMFTLGGVSDL